jgi:hypothetical protein
MNPRKYLKAIVGSLIAAGAVAWKTDGQALVDAAFALVATFVGIYVPANKE